MIRKLKEFLKTWQYTKCLYNKLAEIKYNQVNKQKRSNIQRSGKQTIKQLQRILETTNIIFFFDMGTLLGIIREGRLLGHDLDIDIAIYDNNYQTIQLVRDTLSNYGCRHKFSYTVDGIGIVEDSYIFNNIKFDVNYYKIGKECCKCYLLYTSSNISYFNESEMSTVELSCSPITGIEKRVFAGTEINVPQHAETYLAERYGKQWRIPDKNYIYYKGPSACPISNKGFRLIIR